MEEKILIYTLSDTTGVRYIGQSKRPNKRYYRHIFDANQDGFKNKRCAWIKSLINRGEKPILEIIDEVPMSEWPFWEKYWISQFKTWGFKLTNDTDGGEGTYGRIVSDETKLKMSNSKKGKIPKNLNLLKKSRIKTILQYNLDGTFIKEWESTNKAKKELKINNIDLVLKKKRNSAGNYIWRYKHDKLTKTDVNIIKEKHEKQKRKIILQIDVNGNIIKEWDSVSSVKSVYGHINAVLRGDRTTAGGYQWKYKIGNYVCTSKGI